MKDTSPCMRIFMPKPNAKLSFNVPNWGHHHLYQQLSENDRNDLWAFTTLNADAMANAEVSEIDALDRLFWPEGKMQLCVLGIHSSTTLAPIVVWDLLHSAPVGAEICFADYSDVLENSPATRRYYSGCLSRIEDDSSNILRLRKDKPLPAEADAGLDEWSFLVPVGKPNTEALEEIATRVLELGLGKTELLLCCPEEHKALAPTSWTVVPQPHESATLAEKKNVLVDAASYSNVCVFHDRMIIPKNFKSLVERFGDMYPITGLQNIYISTGDCDIVRYSDYHVETSLQPDALNMIAPYAGGDRGDAGTLHSRYLMTRQGWQASFIEMLPTNYNERSYITGSLYLSKKSVWSMVGQNPLIDWIRLEDVEFGVAAVRDYGIPSRINPYGFARTNRIRPILAELQHMHSQDTLYETKRRDSSQITHDGARPNTEGVFSLQVSAYRERLMCFATRWVPSVYMSEAKKSIFEMDAFSPRSISYTLIRLLYLSLVELEHGQVRAFIQDFGKSATLTDYDVATLDHMCNNVLNGSFLLDEIIKNDYFIKFIYLAARRPLFDPDVTSIEDRIISQAWKKRHDLDSGIVFRGGFKEFVDSILASL